jgi:membrane protein required for colicin V production
MTMTLAFNWLDIILLCILGLFALRGAFQGLVAEVAGFVSIFGGFWLASTCYEQFAPQLTFIAENSWRLIASYVLIFLGFFILVAIITRLLQKALKLVFMTWLDKTAGLVFGGLKGLVLCSLLLIAVTKILGEVSFVQNSAVVPVLKPFIMYLYGLIPPDLLQRIGM